MVRTSKPTVCVVVPVLNEARYIRESMDSLLAQDYEPLEIIVYDGGSTDGTLEILKTYPVRLIVQPGLGQMAAINRGWQQTSAEFVTWWAGDDRYRQGAISRLVSELVAHPEAAVAHADGNLIDADGNFMEHLRSRDVQLQDLIVWFWIVPQSVLIRRSALARSGMMDETRRLAADWDLFLRLAQYYPMHYVPIVVSERRHHEGSEDVKNLGRPLAMACMDVVEAFFRRADLTEKQRHLKPLGIAGSRFWAGWYYCASGNVRMGYQMLVAALRASPKTFFASPAALRLLARLLLPESAIAGLKRVVRTARSRKNGRENVKYKDQVAL